jgi:putative oxidoreductase
MELESDATPIVIPRSDVLDGLVTLATRLLMAQLFLIAGVRKIFGWSTTIKYMGTHLPAPEVLIYAVVIMEVGGGAMLVLGWRTRQVAALLAVFTLLAGLFFHQFWAVPDAQYVAQLNNFLKNIAIVGGLLMLVLHGGGKLSVDGR